MIDEGCEGECRGIFIWYRKEWQYSLYYGETDGNSLKIMASGCMYVYAGIGEVASSFENLLPANIRREGPASPRFQWSFIYQSLRTFEGEWDAGAASTLLPVQCYHVWGEELPECILEMPLFLFAFCFIIRLYYEEERKINTALFEALLLPLPHHCESCHQTNLIHNGFLMWCTSAFIPSVD